MSETTDDKSGQNNGGDEAAVAAAAAAAAKGTDTQTETSADPFTAFGFSDEDKDTREWLTSKGFKDAKSVAKSAYEQSKLIGNSIRIPGENATDEEKAAYLDKLGRPKEAKDYSFKPPENLPKDLPYDGERADRFKGVAHSLGLTDKQAAGLHEWFAGEIVEDFNGAGKQSQEAALATAKSETDKLTKLWGPLDGDQMRTNLAFADKALREVGGDEALAEFQRVGLIGKEGKVIQSAPIAVMLSKLGAALYTEDGIHRGNPDRLDNPFADGDKFNLTAAMKMVKSDKDLALSLISAAGKKPSDFGLK